MSEAWLHNFETQLQRLEQAAAGAQFVPRLLFGHAENCLQTLAQVRNVDYCVVRAGSVEEFDSGGQLVTLPQDAADQRLTELDRCEQPPQIVPLSEGADEVLELHVSSPIADHASFVLHTQFYHLKTTHAGFVEAAQAVCEILAVVFSRHLLSQCEWRIQQQQLMVSMANQLNLADSLEAAAAIIVQEGATVLGTCRLAFIDRSPEKADVLAVTGVRHPRRDAQAIRQIKEIATSSDKDSWIVSGSCVGDGVHRARVLPLSSAARSKSAEKDLPCLTVELLDDGPLPDESTVQQLRAFATSVVDRFGHQQLTLRSKVFHSGWLRWSCLAGLVLAVLVFWPATFEVEVHGTVVAANHRHIFAPEHGTIDRVMFSNEQTVSNGQPLLLLSNADLQLELQQIQGRIDTATAKLAAVQAGRLTSSDPQLSGQEQQLQTEVNNLREQLALLESRTATLNIAAPFSGRVYRQDAEQNLLARPVQRGQRLLEIVPDDEQWTLEMLVPDNLQNYVRNSSSWKTGGPEVHYMLRSSPDQSWTTNLTYLDDAVQLTDGRMTCRALATLREPPDFELRPGTSVTARIDCGRRSLGFVWFRELIEVWQHICFAWF